MAGIDTSSSTSTAIDILYQQMEELNCYENILGEGGGLNTQLCS